MLTADLINNNIPRLQLQDTIAKALLLTNDFGITHLPVVAEDIFLGLISQDELLDVEDKGYIIESLQEHFIRHSVYANEHFLSAVNYVNRTESSIVPVTNKDNELLGVITVPILMKTMGNFSGAAEISGIIVLEMDRSQFSISEISRIVESNDATILHMNTTIHPVTGMLTVTLHLNRKEITTILATFERYDFDIIYSFGNDDFGHEIEGNYLHLMNYLDI